MAVRVVTDSTSDIPPELARELGITVVPAYVRFSNTVYHDGVDMTPQQFHRKLETSSIFPASSQPAPEDFTQVYESMCETAEAVVSIHLSAKISGTLNSATIARNNLMSRCPIEVVDSGLNSAGLGIVVMAAARAASDGGNLAAVLAEAKKAQRQTTMLAVFENLDYLSRSGRVNRSIGCAARVINVMPLLTFRDGEIVRAGFARSIPKAIDKVFDFVDRKKELLEIVIVHSNAPERADQLRRRLGWLFPEDSIRVLDMDAALCAHCGPGVLVVAVREDI